MSENRAADFTGIAKVWKIAHSKELAAAHVSSFGYADSGICTYLVNGPYHPFWSWWYVAIVSLAPVDGAPPAKRQYPEAEYELMIMSIDPSECAPDVAAIERGDLEHRGFEGFLSPPDLVYQFHGITSEQAEQLGDRVALLIANGQSCDVDFRGLWEGALTETVAHIISGAHS